MKTKIHIKTALAMMFIIASTISNIYTQEIQPLRQRITMDNVRGNLIMTGNDIVGVLERRGVDYNPNSAFNILGEVSNGDYTTAYIDVDGDPTTFSSSEARLGLIDNPTREDCSSIVYAGLYWSANYYMARDDTPNNYSDNEISSSTDTDTALIINNGILAQEYTARNSEFSNDNSDIRLSPVTSYLVVAQPVNGCTITNASALSGNIAVIRDGGSCSIRQKVVNAQNAGAVGVVIVNDNNGLMPRLRGNGPTIYIPAVSIGNDDIDNANVNNGNLITELQAQTEVVLATLSSTDDDQLSGLPLTDPRKIGPADFRNIKFKTPGGNYIDITAEDVVFDGYRSTPTNIDLSTNLPNVNANDEVQYVCYSDVTNLIDQNNPFGTYTVANMNATQGQTDNTDGACGGWFLVVIYEDPEESSKYISTSDGYVQIFSHGADVDYTFSGFTTLQGNQPVDVRFGVSGLEGDRGLELDALEVQNTMGGFTALGEGTDDNNDVNATNNFFASTISFDHQHITDRNPASTNTMGFDADLFDLNNNGNMLIGNNQTSATFRLNTNQDRYSVFFNAFSVTIIEPELRIIKRVYDTDGTTEITGNDVELGDELFYDLEIENIGNEDLVDGSVVITDTMPANTNLIGVQDTTLPPGVTYTETSPGVLVFNIPASLVETANDGTPGDPPIRIRFRAQLVSTCEDLRDACSNVIRNSATAAYVGLVSGTPGGTLSSSELGNCGDTDGEASNVLVRVPACTNDVTFCNGDLLLVAGTGYDQYTWTGPGIITPVVTTDNFYQVPNPIAGTYQVVKEDLDPSNGTCMSLTEEYEVEDFRDIDNPILDYVNGTTIVTETCSLSEIPQILLCGNQTQLLQTNFSSNNLNSISWQRLTPGGSCVLDPNDPCSLLSVDCTDANWIEEAGGNTANFTVSEAGDYRIVAEFDGGCLIPFYFSVYKNDYQPQLDMTPIECGNDGSVSVVNLPTNFAFSLTSGEPYENTTGVFVIPPNSGGDINVYAIDTNFPGCEYTAMINVPEINPTFEVTSTNPTCINNDRGTGFGTISIAVTNGLPNYQYTISGASLSGPIVVPNSEINNGSYTQENLPPGSYSVDVISNMPSPQCIFDQDIIIDPAIDFDAEVVLLAPETCDTGALVQVNVLNGSGNYRYADSGGNFQLSNIFEIPSPADPATTYTFFVSDQDVLDGITPACIIEASIDNISPYQAIVIDNITLTQPVCPSDSGQIQVEISPQVTGRIYTYELLTSTSATDTIYTQVDQIVSPSRNILFSDVADHDFYTIQVTHNNTTPPGTTPPSICPVRQGVFAIDSPTEIEAIVSVTEGLSCEVGNTNANVQISSITEGSGTYAWSFDPINGYTDITTLPVNIPISIAGDYTIYIANQGTNTCPISRDIRIESLAIVDGITITENISDCTAQTVEVTAVAEPIGPTYTYSVTPAPISGDATTGVFTLNRGVSYEFTAQRADNECTFNQGFRREVLPEIQITSATGNPVTCFGDTDGSFTFVVANSTSFNYTITGPGTNFTVNGATSPVTIESPGNPLGVGTYTIEVEDTSLASGNCNASTSVDITGPPTQLTVSVTSVSTACGDDTGRITATPGGGYGNYQLELRDDTNTIIEGYPNTNTVFEGLAFGDYTVYVRDGNSPLACQVFAPITVGQYTSPTIAAVPGGDVCVDTDPATQWITITPDATTLSVGPFEYDLTGPLTANNVPVTFLSFPPNPQNTFEIPNLIAGSYTVTVRNITTNCVSSAESFTINPELTITATLTKDIDCNSGATLAFTPGAGSGSGTYNQFDLYNPGSPPTLVQANITSPYADPAVLVPGDYLVGVVDDAGCTAFSNTVTVTPYVTLTAGPAVITEPACDGETGFMTVNVTAGNGPFTYVLDGDVTTQIGPTGATTATFEVTSGVSHTVRITDGATIVPPATACTVDVTATLTNPPPITAVIDIGILNCTVTPNALVDVTISGGSNSYEWSTDGVTYTPAGTTIFTIPFTEDGNYILSIRNAVTYDCLETFPITIDSLLEVTDITFTESNDDCVNQTVTVIPNAVGDAPVPTYTYTVVPAPVSGNATTGFVLNRGTNYRFTATRGDNSCIYAEDFRAELLDVIQITNAQQTSATTCNAGNDGAFTFSFDTTTFTSFEYEIRGPLPGTALLASGTTGTSPFIINNTVTPLGAGDYQITVTDTSTGGAGSPLNCSDTATITITEPDPITFTLEPFDQDCAADTNSVSISNVQGGSGSGYTYTLTNAGNGTNLGPQSTNIAFYNVPNGTGYQIIVTDSNACTSSTLIFDIDRLDQLDASIAATSDFCLDDGAVSFTIDIDGTNSGTPDYIYNVTRNGVVVIPDTNVGASTNFTTTPALTQPGDYVVTIIDSNGCPVVLPTQTIQPAVELVVTHLSDITCDPITGALIPAEFSFAVNGGYTPYDIAVSIGGGAFADHLTNATAPFANYTNGTAGSYVFRVTDDRGCTFTTAPFTVTDPAAININAPTVNLDCYGDIGTAVIGVTGTEGPYEIDFQNTGTFVTITGTQITFPNLGEAIYPFTVRSNRGCTDTGTVEITTPDPITEVGRTETPVTCGGSGTVTDLGAIDLEIAGGTANYTYTLVTAANFAVLPLVPAATAVTTPNPTTTGTTVRFEGLDFGQYFIFVTDVNGCTDNAPFGPFNIFSPPDDLVQNITVSATCPGGVTFEIDVQGGSGVNPPANPPPGFDIRIVGESSPGLGDFVPLDDSVGGATPVDANTPIRDHTYNGLDFNRTYVLEVRDNATGCLYQEMVAPESPPSEPSIINDVVTDVSCNETPALDDGSVTFDVSAYDPTVTEISWEVFNAFTNVSLGAAYTGSDNTTPSPAVPNVPVTINNIPPGQYYVTVREVDGTQCPTRYDFTIDLPDLVTSVATNQTPANSCGTNAQVIMDTDGGTQFTIATVTPIPPGETADGYTYAVVPNGAGDPGVYPLNNNVIDLGNTVQTLDIWVADANGCSFGPITVTTVVNLLPTVVATFVDDCAYDNTNVIDIDGGGLGTLTYQLDGGTAVTGSIDNNNHQFTVATSGTYTITITDDSGCSVSTTVDVYEPLEISAEFTTPPVCDTSSGTITTTITSGVVQGTETYDLLDGAGNPIVGNTSGDANGIYTLVAPGTYIIRVTDDGRGIAPGCSFNSLPISIEAPTLPVLLPQTNTQITCTSDTDGVINAVLDSATEDLTATYLYETVAPSPEIRGQQMSPQFTGLPAGTYTVRVTATEINGALSVLCTDDQTYTIEDPGAVVANGTAVDPILCGAGNTITSGTIEVTIDATAGTGPNYFVTVTQPDGVIINRIAVPVPIPAPPTAALVIDAPIDGTYNITVFDSNDCSLVLAPVNVLPLPVMSNPTVNPGVPIDCNTNVQEITISVDGGTGPFNFVEVNGAVPPQNGVVATLPTTTSSIFTLPPDSSIVYVFEVTDVGTGCTIRTPAYSVPDYDTIEATIALGLPPIDCFGDLDGVISLDVIGHVGAYSYVATNLTTTTTVVGVGDTTVGTTTINSLGSGNIQVTVTDPVSNCTDDSNIVFIDQPEQLTLSIVPGSNINANCNEDARVMVSVTGGTGPYTFRADDDGIFPFLFETTTSSTTQTFLLPATIAGTTYVISVIDNNSCTSIPVSINETMFRTPDPTITSAAWTDTCVFDDEYIINVIGVSNVPAPGTGALRFQINSEPAVDGNVSITEHNFTVTTLGTYTIRVFDENGCVSTNTGVTMLPELIVNADFTVDPTCRDTDGTITVNPIGGSDFIANPGNFTFTLIDDVTNGTVLGPQASNIFTPVAAGDYRVDVTDAGSGCTATGDILDVPIPNDPILSETSTPVSCIGSSDGTVTVSIDPLTDNGGQYSYQLYENNGGTLAITGLAIGTPQNDNPIFTGLSFDALPAPHPTAGEYLIAVTSNKGCVGLIAFVIPNATQVTATSTQSPFTCTGTTQNFPEITVTMENGTPPYSITYTTPSGTVVTDLNVIDADPALGVQYIFTGDEVGDYVITVTDSKGCLLPTPPGPTITETINALPIMTAAQATLLQRMTCDNTVDEIVRVEVTGGSGNYLFERLDATGVVVDTQAANPAPNDNSADFTLPRIVDAVYNFRITDNTTTCTIETSYNLAEFDFIDVIATEETPETCFQGFDGEIEVEITGYTGNFSYTVIDAATGTVATDAGGIPIPSATGGPINAGTDPFSIVLPFTATTGNYRVIIDELDDPLCSFTSDVVTIGGPTIEFVLTLTAINDTEFCDPAANGGIQASVIGVQGTVTYELALVSAPTTVLETNTDGRFEGLTADVYQVTATDDNGTFNCTDIDNFTINPPADDVAVVLVETNVSCFGEADGSITVNVTGTDGPPFAYTITPSGGEESAKQVINEFNFLSANSYTITVYDQLGCSETAIGNITEPSEVTVTIDNVTEVACGLDTIDVTISGTSDLGTIGMTYFYVDQNGNEVSNGGNSTFTALSEGQYQFFVEDVNGCRSQLSSPVPVLPIDPIGIFLDTRFAVINCFNETTAIIDATVTGGIGNYVFELTNNTTGQNWGPQATSRFRDLPPGNYTYLVRTDRNCVEQENFDIVNPPEFTPTMDFTNVVCNGEDNGTITIFASGGTAPYSYAISSEPGTFFNDASDNVPNEHTFTDLPPGAYEVLAQDVKGCDVVFDVDIVEPDVIQANIVGAVTPETCLYANDGAVTIAITGGIAPYETNITNNDADFVQDMFTYTSLPGGTTIIYIRDANNCRIELPVIIPAGVILEGALEPRIECPVRDENDPSIIVQGPRYFVNYALSTSSVNTDIIFTLTGVNGTSDPAQTTNLIGDFEVNPGVYQGTMEHSGGCIVDLGNITIEEYTPLEIPVAQMTNNPQDPNEYEIIASGGRPFENTPFYSFSFAMLEDGMTLSQLSSEDYTELDGNIFVIRQTADYVLRVVDASGCEIFIVQNLTYINIRIPNYFTPNNPNSSMEERFWYPRQITPNVDDPFFFENMEVTVFDRYGRMLAEFKGDEQGWDGLYQGKQLPSGDYWYTIILNDIDNREFTGHFTLYR